MTLNYYNNADAKRGLCHEYFIKNYRYFWVIYNDLIIKLKKILKNTRLWLAVTS